MILVPHRPAGTRLKIAAVAAATLFVGAAAFAAATLQPYLADRALVDTKLDVARTAANAITTLWTYTPDNMDSLPARSAGYLGGDFANEYRKYIDAIVAPNKQAQVTNTTQVMGAAVETLTPSEATAIVYTNSVATSPVTKNIPSLRYLSYRLDDGAPGREVADHPDGDHHVAGSDAAAVETQAMPVVSPGLRTADRRRPVLLTFRPGSSTRSASWCSATCSWPT